jgi:hypothetical protein
LSEESTSTTGYWCPYKCQWATRKDGSELLAKYGLSSIDHNKNFGPQPVRRIYFDEWMLNNGVERAKEVWSEWIRADPGFWVRDAVGKVFNIKINL